MSIVQQAAPTQAHIDVYRLRLYQEPDEEVFWTKDQASWSLLNWDEGDYPDEVKEMTRVDALARIAAAERELHRRARYGVSRGPIDIGWPREIVDQIKASNRLEDEVGRFRQLFRAGTNFKVHCPFHNGGAERTPSFHIYVDQQRWHCFGCQQGGDIIAFMQLAHHVEFRDAMEYLADRSGIPIPDRASRPSRAVNVRVG